MAKPDSIINPSDNLLDSVNFFQLICLHCLTKDEYSVNSLGKTWKCYIWQLQIKKESCTGFIPAGKGKADAQYKYFSKLQRQ